MEIKNITKEYTNQQGKKQKVIENFSLTVGDGEFIAIVGPSGCGKTTLLRILAGLESLDHGSVVVCNENVCGPSTNRGVVFQDYSLFPWLTVEGNIRFGLQMKGLRKGEQDKTIQKYLEITGLENSQNLYPSQLSGGMKQRVAVARTFATNPEVLFMDEPFGALDVQTRSLMQEFLVQIWEQEKKTVVFVTHDIEEALFLADRVIVLGTNPLHIKQEINVSFARPRKHALKLTSEFYKKKCEIMNVMEK